MQTPSEGATKFLKHENTKIIKYVRTTLFFN